jgi:molybdopterin molybdotransferase
MSGVRAWITYWLEQGCPSNRCGKRKFHGSLDSWRLTRTLPDVHRPSANPRIPRLVSLEAALTRLASLAQPVVAKEIGLVEAVGAVLASRLQARADLPPHPIANTDGWAVRAEDLIGSSGYNAAVLQSPRWVDAGDAMPDADAVLAPEGVTFMSSDVAEAVGSVVPGEGVRHRGQDIAAGEILLEEGTRLEPRHIGLLRACGFETVGVRIPRLRIAIASEGAALQGPMIRAWLEAAGGHVEDVVSAPGDRDALATQYRRPGADLVISLGGTGQGRDDCAVAALLDAGSVAVQGVALRPGATAAFGSADSATVLLLPGRLDAMMAGMLVLAMPAVAGATGFRNQQRSSAYSLVEKATSVVGLSEVFLGLPAGDAMRAVPLAEARLDALAQAVGWFIVPPELEGFAAGQTVHLRSFHPG